MSFPINKNQNYMYILLHVITTVVAFTTSPSTSITKLSNRNNNYTRNKCIVYKSSSRGGGDSDKSNKDENNKDNNNDDDDPERNNRNNLDHLSRYESLIQGDYDLSRFPNPLMDPMRDYRHDSSMDNKNIRFGRDFEDDGRRHHHHPMNHPMQGQGPNHHHHPMDHPMHMHDGPNNNHHPMNHPMQGQGPNNHHPMIDNPMHMHDGPETYINNDGFQNNNDRFDNYPMNQHDNDRNSEDYISTLQSRLKEAEMSKNVQRRMYEGPQMKGRKNTNRNNRFNVRPSMNRVPTMDSGFDRSNRRSEQRVGDNDNLTPFGSEYIDNRDLNQRRSMNFGRRGGGAREELMDERRAMNSGRRGGGAREGPMDERRAMNHGRRGGGAREGLMDERRAMNPGRRGGGAREELMDERYIRHLEAKIDEQESRMNKNHGHPHNHYNRRNAPPPFFGRGSNNGYGSSYGGNHYHGR